MCIHQICISTLTLVGRNLTDTNIYIVSSYFLFPCHIFSTRMTSYVKTSYIVVVLHVSLFPKGLFTLTECERLLSRSHYAFAICLCVQDSLMVTQRLM